MFKYATTTNKLMYFVGICASIATGLTTPANSLIFGNLANVSFYYNTYFDNLRCKFNFTSFLFEQSMIEFGGPGEYTRADEKEMLFDAVAKFALENTIIGVIMLACSYISITLFNYAAHAQILRIRGKFFRSILHQDMAWYDFNQSGEVASRMNE